MDSAWDFGVPEGDPLSAVAMWTFSYLFDSVVSARSGHALQPALWDVLPQ